LLPSGKGLGVSKLVLDLRVPSEYKRADFAEIIRAICNTVNSLSEGKMASFYNAQSSVPTSAAAAVSFAVGDFIPDSNCTVRGGAGSQYVRVGWRCVSPGNGATATFVESRELTGT
jgi:hypothetical protein